MATTPDLCPFKMMALGVRHGGAVFVEGGVAKMRQDIDLACVGPTCMAFVTTKIDPDGHPRGACGIAVTPSLTKALDTRLERLEAMVEMAVRNYLRVPWYARAFAWLKAKLKRRSDSNVVQIDEIKRPTDV